MKNKSTLTLIEQLIMLLVFAAAAAVSLKIFAYSDSLSAERAMTDRAVIAADNAAQAIKAAGGDFEAAAEILEANATPGGLRKTLTEDSGEEEELTLEANITDTGSPYTSGAEIKVFSGEKELYSLKVLWQEETA